MNENCLIQCLHEIKHCTQIYTIIYTNIFILYADNFAMECKLFFYYNKCIFYMKKLIGLLPRSFPIFNSIICIQIF